MRRNKKAGFSLAELLFFVATLSLLSWLLLPQVLLPRLQLNEEIAERTLKVVGAGQRMWAKTSGNPVPLSRFTLEAPPMQDSLAPNFRLPLVPASFRVGPAGTVSRGGYRFEDWMEKGTHLTGCVATPEPSGYGGRKGFRIRYSTGEVESFLVEP